MRTTLTIDDALITELKQLAARQRVPFKQAVERTLRAGLGALKRPPAQRAPRHRTASMGIPTIGMDKALALAAELEDSEIARKLELRK
jgi:hypothetical protein